MRVVAEGRGMQLRTLGIPTICAAWRDVVNAERTSLGRKLSVKYPFAGAASFAEAHRTAFGCVPALASNHTDKFGN